MYKETCKTTKFIDFKIQKCSLKYDNSVSFSTFKMYQYQPLKGKKYKN